MGKKKKEEERLYIIYDQRAYTLDPAECAIMDTEFSLHIARRERDKFYPNYPIYSYKMTSPLSDQRLEE